MTIEIFRALQSILDFRNFHIRNEKISFVTDCMDLIPKTQKSVLPKEVFFIAFGYTETNVVSLNSLDLNISQSFEKKIKM